MRGPQVVGIAALAVFLPQEILAISKMDPPAQEAGGGMDDKIEALRQEMQATMQAGMRREAKMQASVDSLQFEVAELKQQNKALAER